jgi:ribonuclease P protein subunit RPR2
MCTHTEKLTKAFPRLSLYRRNRIMLFTENPKSMHEAKQIALERIRVLFNLARETIHENPTLAQRYVNIARRISMTAKVRLPVECRRQVCRYCKRFILPGVNCRVRLQQQPEPHVVVTCLLCSKRARFPLKNRRKTKHANARNETQNKT